MMDPLKNVLCYILDMDGTFYLGNRLLPGASRLVKLLERQGKDFLFLTNNSSRNRADYAAKINRLGLSIPESKVFTSGEATALYLQSHYPAGRLFVVGTPSLEAEFRNHGFNLDDHDPQVVVLGFDTTLTYAKLWKLCDFVRAGLPYYATHPDFNCPTETGFMPDIGAIIAFVEASTGRKPDRVIGKPNRAIIEAAGVKVGIEVERLAMVGDRLYTDIALGQTSGIPTILVLSGETRMEDLADSPFQPNCIFENLDALADHLDALEKGTI